VDTLGAQKAVLRIATDLGLKVTASVAYEIPPKTGQFLFSILDLLPIFYFYKALFISWHVCRR
jgi:hypothetical protein